MTTVAASRRPATARRSSSEQPAARSAPRVSAYFCRHDSSHRRARRALYAPASKARLRGLGMRHTRGRRGRGVAGAARCLPACPFPATKGLGAACCWLGHLRQPSLAPRSVWNVAHSCARASAAQVSMEVLRCRSGVAAATTDASAPPLRSRRTPHALAAPAARVRVSCTARVHVRRGSRLRRGAVATADFSQPAGGPASPPPPPPRFAAFSRVLVAGATGGTGAAVVARLQAEGVRVRALVRDPDSAAARALPPAVERARGDVYDFATLPAALDGWCVPAQHAVETHP